LVGKLAGEFNREPPVLRLLSSALRVGLASEVNLRLIPTRRNQS